MDESLAAHPICPARGSDSTDILKLRERAPTARQFVHYRSSAPRAPSNQTIGRFGCGGTRLDERFHRAKRCAREQHDRCLSSRRKSAERPFEAQAVAHFIVEYLLLNARRIAQSNCSSSSSCVILHRQSAARAVLHQCRFMAGEKLQPSYAAASLQNMMSRPGSIFCTRRHVLI